MSITLNIFVGIISGLIVGFCLYKYRIYRFKKSLPLEGRYGIIVTNKGTFEVKELNKTEHGRIKLLCENIKPSRKYPASGVLLDKYSNMEAINESRPFSVDPISNNAKKYIIWVDEKKIDWLNNNRAISRERKLSRLT